MKNFTCGTISLPSLTIKALELNTLLPRNLRKQNETIIKKTLASVGKKIKHSQGSFDEELNKIRL